MKINSKQTCFGKAKDKEVAIIKGIKEKEQDNPPFLLEWLVFEAFRLTSGFNTGERKLQMMFLKFIGERKNNSYMAAFVFYDREEGRVRGSAEW